MVSLGPCALLGSALLCRAQREKIQPHLHFDARLHFLAFQRRDALFEELAIKLETDGGDVAALLRAEQVARAANFQVAHGDFKAAAEAWSIV